MTGFVGRIHLLDEPEILDGETAGAGTVAGLGSGQLDDMIDVALPDRAAVPIGPYACIALAGEAPMHFIPIQAGTFSMGSPDDEKDRFDDEGPRRCVTVAAFQLAETEVTQKQWRADDRDGASACSDGRGMRGVIDAASQATDHNAPSMHEQVSQFRGPSASRRCGVAGSHDRDSRWRLEQAGITSEKEASRRPRERGW